MAATVETAAGSGTLSQTGETMQHIADMCWDLCNAFLDWEREHLLNYSPDSNLLRQHQQDLKWLIRLVKLLNTMASDPEFPKQSIQDDFRAVLERLNRSWQLFHAPGISQQDAERILRECFPDGSGT